MNPAPLLRTWAACLVGCLPLLALLLVPQLLRSRAGSGELLMLGVTLLILLLVTAFTVAPVLSAWFTPETPSWTPSTALRSARSVWGHRTGAALTALLLGVAVYAAGQAVGYALAEVVPVVSDNPLHGVDPAAPRWSIHYPAFALQAVVIYLCSTAAIAVYAWRIRTLHLAATTEV